MQCPNCGSELFNPQYTPEEVIERAWRRSIWGGITCDNCPAVIRVSHDRALTYLVSGMFVGVALGFPSILILQYTGNVLPTLVVLPTLIALLTLALRGSNMGRAEILRMRPSCKHCGAVMENEDTNFCPKCGASITKGARGRPQEADRIEITTPQRIGICMVCNLSLEATDILAWCPHCGSSAHKTHLLEWVHVKRQCPKCGQHIDEREINLRTPEKGAGKEKRKKIWKTV